MKRGYGQPPGSKNKLKTMDLNLTIAIMANIAIIEAYLSAKEQADYKLALCLRKEGKITTEGTPFELSDKKEVDALIGQGVFVFKMFELAKHSGNCIFKSQMVYKVKGKGTNALYKKSQLVIQGHSDSSKELVLTQSLMI